MNNIQIVRSEANNKSHPSQCEVSPCHCCFFCHQATFCRNIRLVWACGVVRIPGFPSFFLSVKSRHRQNHKSWMQTVSFLREIEMTAVVIGTISCNKRLDDRSNKGPAISTRVQKRNWKFPSGQCHHGHNRGRGALRSPEETAPGLSKQA